MPYNEESRAKHRATLLAKYGGKEGLSKHMSENGKKAAEAYMAKPKEERLPRGFAKDPEAAAKYGKIGGSKKKVKKEN